MNSRSMANSFRSFFGLESIDRSYIVYTYGFVGMWFFTGLTRLIGGLIALKLTETIGRKPTLSQREEEDYLLIEADS